MKTVIKKKEFLKVIKAKKILILMPNPKNEICIIEWLKQKLSNE
jgi:hypothetical protein